MAKRESDFWSRGMTAAIGPDRIADVLSAAADIVLVVAPDGTIRTVMPGDGGRAPTGWEGRMLADVLAPDSRAKAKRTVAMVAGDPGSRPPPIEVNHAHDAGWDAPIRYTLHPTDDGAVLMLGRDLTPIVDLQQRLARAQAAVDRDRDGHRMHETRFRVLMEAARDGFALADVATGRIAEANAAACDLLGLAPTEAVGTALAALFEGQRKADLFDRLAAPEPGGTVALVAGRTGATVHVRPTAFRSGGERMLLLAMAGEGGPDGAGGDDGDHAAALVAASSDGIAFTDADGIIVDANDALASLTDLPGTTDLQGRSLADFLARGVVDMRMLAKEGAGRAHATQAVSAFGTRTDVEIVATPLPDGGFGFALREARRTDAPSGGTPSGAMEPAIAKARTMVGTAALRDIVASMTDEIERECIEQAVALTDNNRVAAAEMLGLSRQSLYVKLRKFGLLHRGED